MQPEVQSEDLIFCYSQENSNTIVMLYPSEKVAKKMLKPIYQLYVLWITEDMPEHLKQKTG